MGIRKKKFGFALVEVLLGALILAVGAAVVSQLCRRCLVDNLRGIEYEQAARLLDECLDQVSGADLLPALIINKIIVGDFEGRCPNYRYVLELTPAEQADLYRIDATVFWEVSGKEYQLQASTLIYDLNNR